MVIKMLSDLRRQGDEKKNENLKKEIRSIRKYQTKLLTIEKYSGGFKNRMDEVGAHQLAGL